LLTLTVKFKADTDSCIAFKLSLQSFSLKHRTQMKFLLVFSNLSKHKHKLYFIIYYVSISKQ